LSYQTDAFVVVQNVFGCVKHSQELMDEKKLVSDELLLGITI